MSRQIYKARARVSSRVFDMWGHDLFGNTTLIIASSGRFVVPYDCYYTLLIRLTRVHPLPLVALVSAIGLTGWLSAAKRGERE